MKASPVRELARRHAAGELSLADYRAQRHALIDNIASGRQTLNYEERIAPRPAAPIPSRFILLAGAAILVIIVIGVVIWAIGTRSVAPSAVSTPTQATLPSPGPQLVGDFLRVNNWSASQTRNFIHQWNELPGKERELARQDYHYPRLVSELRQQIVSQQAMSGLTTNNDTSQAQLAGLYDMAKVLGVETDN